MAYIRYFFYSNKKEKWIPCRDEESCVEMDSQGFNVKKVVYEGKPPRMPKSERKKANRRKTEAKSRDRRRSGRGRR